jgi:hypothetical protein
VWQDIGSKIKRPAIMPCHATAVAGAEVFCCCSGLLLLLLFLLLLLI